MRVSAYLDVCVREHLIRVHWLSVLTCLGTLRSSVQTAVALMGTIRNIPTLSDTVSVASSEFCTSHSSCDPPPPLRVVFSLNSQRITSSHPVLVAISVKHNIALLLSVKLFHVHPLQGGVSSQLLCESSSPPPLRTRSIRLLYVFATLLRVWLTFYYTFVTSVFLTVTIVHVLLILAVIKATEIRSQIWNSLYFTLTTTRG